MACPHDLPPELSETAFSIEAPPIVFGRGSIRELGDHARALGITRAMVVTDPRVAKLPLFEDALRSLRSASIDLAVFAEVAIEPTDRSFAAATEFARGGGFDGHVSIGGGSAIDTAKAAALYSTFPAPLAKYVNRPLGEGAPIPGPLPPHVACPTTSGTGAECTGIAVFDWIEHAAKTGIASRRLRPALAIVDPDATRTLPRSVVAASGFDVICHAIESLTARSFAARPRPTPASARPMSQGRNPFSDIGSMDALRIAGRFFQRAVDDAHDDEARGEMMWAAALAGVAFGNAGVHVPHGMSYAIAGLVREYHLDGYPPAPLVPHGAAVVLGAPSVFERTFTTSPERHRAAAIALGADPRDGEGATMLARRVRALMRATDIPVALAEVGYGASDLDALTERAMLQTRLLDNAPMPIDRGTMRGLFEASLEENGS